ncbi:MAG: zinc ribbon domain-containing protein [Nitrososphaerota archaeon]
MYAKLKRFIEIPTRLPENLKTAKEYAKQLVKQNGKHCIFTNSKKVKEIKENIEKKIENAEKIVSEKAIKHLEKKKIIAIKNNFIKLERNYVRSNDEFKTVIIPTEDLSNNFQNKSKELNFKIRRWFYRKILNYLINSANWNRISTIYVDPQNTSKTCPKCNNELEKDKNFNDLHHFECKNCGFKDDRDYIAVTNITKKFLMKLWEIRARLFLGFGMNKDQSLEREGLRTQPKTFLQAQ